MITKERITELANEKIQGTSLFVVEVKVLNGNKIEVYLDGDDGIGINQCVDVSRFIEGNLDREKEDFSLIVSSPDATKPLKLRRQFLRHIGRDFEFILKNGETREGTLLKVNEDGKLKIEYKSRENKPIGKGKITVTKEEELELENIIESKIKLKF